MSSLGMSRLELKLKSATVVRDSDGCLGVRPPFLDATDPTGDMFTGQHVTLQIKIPLRAQRQR